MGCVHQPTHALEPCGPVPATAFRRPDQNPSTTPGPRADTICVMWRATLLLLILTTLLSGCTYVTSRDDVLFTSDPPGAHIWVDGTDSGFTTPKVIPLGGTLGSDHDVRLTKKGYRPAMRRLYQHTEGYTSKWIDGAYEPTMPALPFFWTFGDFILPFGVRSAIVPGQLHVKLYREDEPLLGFELLAARKNGDDGGAAADPPK